MPSDTSKGYCSSVAMRHWDSQEWLIKISLLPSCWVWFFETWESICHINHEQGKSLVYQGLSRYLCIPYIYSWGRLPNWASPSNCVEDVSLCHHPRSPLFTLLLPSICQTVPGSLTVNKPLESDYSQPLYLYLVGLGQRTQPLNVYVARSLYIPHKMDIISLINLILIVFTPGYLSENMVSTRSL